ncbi:glycosyltransferase family 2 protein [Pseudaestuariivita sp.]|uniref:glycosyltransferase family 2 protein n=1 Tax=Pseudaestuariivita sp. TaxID=2211669 RepID=UPI0040585890
MSTAQLTLAKAQAVRAGQHVDQPVGRILMDVAALDAADLSAALIEHASHGAPVADTLTASGVISRPQVVHALARRHAALHLDSTATPPDPALACALPVDFCLAHGAMPWAKIGDATLIATAYPEKFAELRAELPDHLHPVIMGVASEEDIQTTLATWHRDVLVAAAETEMPEALSCRTLGQGYGLRLAPLLFCAAFVATLLYDARLLFGALAIWAVGSLMLAAFLKISAFTAHFFARRAEGLPVFFHRPKVSMLVPLFRETGIALDLIERLKRLAYPKALLDVVLVLEEEDTQTHDLIAGEELPPWMRVITVPKGEVTTKPRALNYALKFCRGKIVGIWDAEDAPEPHQIDKVVARFAGAPREVACLQGILDFYNPHANWLSRCFAIEYATWFRVILPGLERLGFAIPLGGTTVFFRRDALEEVHGWDAHNVTEDADLGMRLARYGYRTEMIATHTDEEACNHFWPWIKQRSRWLKGYMVTYLVHMRAPVRLLRELGAWKFLGFQVFFLTSLSQFLLAPVLWSFWLVLLGFAHPLEHWISTQTIWHIGLAFLLSEITSILIGMFAVSRTRHTGLAPWVPTLMFYFPLGCAAAYKGLFELIQKPFYWDKTTHGTHVTPAE